MPESGRHPDERGADRRSDYLDARAAADNPAFDRTTPEPDRFRQERPEPNDHPTGEELAAPEEIDESRTDELLKKLYEKGGDVDKVAKNSVESVQELLSKKPPAGHPEVRTPHANGSPATRGQQR